MEPHGNHSMLLAYSIILLVEQAQDRRNPFNSDQHICTLQPIKSRVGKKQFVLHWHLTPEPPLWCIPLRHSQLMEF